MYNTYMCSVKKKLIIPGTYQPYKIEHPQVLRSPLDILLA